MSNLISATSAASWRPLGAWLTETLFDGGLRSGNKNQATAAYEGNVAAYRQTVLAGFQQVEDNLAALRILEQEAEVQTGAVDFKPGAGLVA